jgi:hypothetical protein
LISWVLSTYDSRRKIKHDYSCEVMIVEIMQQNLAQRFLANHPVVGARVGDSGCLRRLFSFRSPLRSEPK